MLVTIGLDKKSTAIPPLICTYCMNMGLLFSVTEQKSLAFAVCRLRGSVLQAATLSISEVLQPLWKTIAQASNVEVGIDAGLNEGLSA